MGKSESNLIRWIASRWGTGREDVPVGIGDDMAMLRVAGERVLITVDMLMDGVDFDTAIHTPRQIGRKALAVNLSDCAAMAVRPRWVLVSVALPDSWGMSQAQELYAGIEELASQHDCAVVGGDTNSWPQPLVIDVIVVASPWEGVEPVRRSGMRPGDAVCVTGLLGGSLRGHHLDFEPRVQEARLLAQNLGSDLHAMMDISDGLSLDGHRMAEASGCGMELEEAALRAVASGAAKAASAEDGRDLLEHVLHDGEDFELLFAVAPHVLDQAPPQGQWLRIGAAIHQDCGMCLRRADGSRVPIERGGWEHWVGPG